MIIHKNMPIQLMNQSIRNKNLYICC